MIRTLCLAVSCLSLLGACRSERPPKDIADVPLASKVVFDGATLAGWDGDARFWSVEDGCIVGRSTNEVPCAETTYLLWRSGELADFELGFDFKIEGGNSGLQFRSVDRGGWSVAGFQADIEDGPNWTGCLYEQDGAGVVATRGEDVTLGSNGVAKSRFAGADELLALVRPREWNRYVVRARGAEVELAINGHRTARVLDLRPVRRTSGLIALQMHAGPPMKVAYRNFELRELERVEPAAVAEVELPKTPPKSATAPVQPSSSGVRPLWLWASDTTPDGDTSVLRRSFDVRATPTKAVLRASADNHVRLFVNGELALENHDWAAPLEVDATKWLRAGENELALIAKNDGGPAGVWVELIVDGAQGRLVRVITDTSWSAVRSLANTDFDAWTPRDFDATRSAAPHSFGAFGVGPWGGSSTASQGDDEPEERALPAEELTLLPGFRAELLYSVPKGEQGSWVSMCEDPRGRLYVSDQYGALYRVTVGSAAAQTRVEKVPLALGSAHGLCWAFDSLYVVVSEGGGGNNGLYRVRDTDGDDVLDASELLRKFEGGGEHGPHAVVLGPDDKLWIVGGNHTKLPEPIDSYRLPKTWGEDMLLPRIEDPNGHAVGIRAPAGWIVNTDADGKHWELWCAGFRNAYDIAFDTNGELFTFDSDMEWDIGAPWYQPTRIFHCVSGADFGWRGGPGKMPPDYPDTLPSVVDIGMSSPTGVTFGTGAEFPLKYQRAMFALDWAYGTLYAVHMEPRGASFTGTFEKFATGKPFPVTDVVIGRDGAMYVTTGGRKTQSGLYRITWTAPIEQDSDLTRRIASWQIDETSRERSDRKKCEEYHDVDMSRWDDFKAGVEAISLCAHAVSTDPFVARAAMAALERIPPSKWFPWNFAGGRVGAALSIAALHTDATGMRDEVVKRILAWNPRLNEIGEVIDFLRVVELTAIRCAPLDAAVRAQLRAKVETFPFPFESSTRVDRELVQLLVALESPRVIEPAIALMESDAPQEEKIWAAYCLRCAKVGWTPELRVRFFTALDTLHTTAKGGFSLTKYLEEIRRQSIDALSDDDKKALGSLLTPPSAQARPQAAVQARFVQAWTREQLAPSLRDELRGRNFEHGQLAYAKARCSECHRLGGEGGATGPDLTGAGSRFSRSDWLEAILEPSKAISDQYQDTELLTHDGDLFVGRIERDDSRGLALRRLPPQDDVIEFPHDQIERRRLHPVSRMPAGLLDVLTHDEVLDLAAYVLTGANPNAPEFQPR